MPTAGVRGKIESLEAQRGGSSRVVDRSIRTGTDITKVQQKASPARPSPSTRASKNRVDRIRQQHDVNGSSGSSGPAITTTTATTTMSSSSRQGDSLSQQPQEAASALPVEPRVNLQRRTEYADATTLNNKPKNFQKDVASPNRGRNRLSKMQRMQRMLGYDSSKKNMKKPRHSTAEASTVSAATTEVANNHISSKQKSSSTTIPERRQRQTTLMQSRVKRHSALNYKSPRRKVNAAAENSHSPQPQNNNNGVSGAGMAALSPTSDTDNFGPTDQTIDTANTDDDATLTSVRQIMQKDNTNHDSDHKITPTSRKMNRSYHYQHLQTFEDSNHPRNSGGGSASHARDGSKAGNITSSDNGIYRREFSSNWQEEKSDKANIPRVFRATSSSDYDTDGDLSKTLQGPSYSEISDVNEFFTHQTKPKLKQKNNRHKHRATDDDENTFDYGDRDDDSASFAISHRRLPGSAVQLTKDKQGAFIGDLGKSMQDSSKKGPSPIINKDDMEQYTKSIGSPALKMGVGVASAVTVGCLVLGPAGLLAGAALVGLGIGATQIPEEERGKIQTKMQKVANKVHERALDASEKLSNSCATSYEDSGVAEHLPPCLALPSKDTSGAADEPPSISAGQEDLVEGKTGTTTKVLKKQAMRNKQGQNAGLDDAGNFRIEKKKANMDRARSKKVACLRNGRILPLGQIYGLDPSQQPSAWLDVIASAHTSEDEKMEALEEIMILAKDKRRAQIFLDEGILDSLIWTVDRYLEKVRNPKSHWINKDVTPNEKRSAKLAASCCVTLGKTHCAAIHTEGDLQLMSLYQRGAVPEERQVAQMLCEIPHHIRITKTDDPTIVKPTKEIFSIRQLSLQHAVDYSRSIKEIIDGKI